MLYHYEKQLVLYSKGYFNKSVNLYYDLQLITSKAFGISIELVNKYNVFNFVMNTYSKLIELGHIKYLSTSNYLLKNIAFNNLKMEDNSLLEFLIGELSIVKVNDLDLGQVDEELKYQLGGI